MANPFTQARELMKLQKEAKATQKKMQQVIVSGTSRDNLISVTMNGLQEVEDIVIGNELLNEGRKRELIKDLKDALKKAQKEVQKAMMKNMDLDKIRNLLG